MELLKRYGMNLVRLRLWNDPYSEAGEPYGAGTNDLEKTVTHGPAAEAGRGGLAADPGSHRGLAPMKRRKFE